MTTQVEVTPLNEGTVKLLALFLRKDFHPIYRAYVGGTFVEAPGSEYEIALATDGHSIVARVQGDRVGELSCRKLLRFLRVAPTTTAVDKVACEGWETWHTEIPRYWDACKASTPEIKKIEDQGALCIGLDAEYLARVGMIQRAMGRDGMDALRAKLRAAKERKDRVEVSALERLVQRLKDELRKPALTYWEMGGGLDPAFFVVQQAADIATVIDSNEAWVGAIMPWRT